MPNVVTPLRKGQHIRGTWLDQGLTDRDESGIAARQLAAFLADVKLPDRDVLQAQCGITPRMIYRILHVEQDVVSLGVVARLLETVDEDIGAVTYRGDLTAIPFRGKTDALMMAVYEHLDDDDRLTVTWKVIESRAAELLAERKRLISG